MDTTALEWKKWVSNVMSVRKMLFRFVSVTYIFFFLVFWVRVRLSLLGTSATNWPIVPAPDNRWRVWTSRWNENCKGKPKYSEKICPSATLSTTNPTSPDVGLNPGNRSGKSTNNRLSYSMASRKSLTLHEIEMQTYEECHNMQKYCTQSKIQILLKSKLV
jgi:hypothetical protein